MANSWSFLHDEMNMSNQDFWIDDGISLTGNPGPYAADTVSFSSTFYGGSGQDTLSFVDPGSSAPPVVIGGSRVPGGMGNDHITFTGGQDTLGSVNLDTAGQKQWKYNENEILKELTEYITATYNQHYSSDKIQTLDLIESCGDGEAFCRSNILKYASRYDKKGTARRDILKIMHYAVLLMYFNDKNNTTETYNQ